MTPGRVGCRRINSGAAEEPTLAEQWDDSRYPGSASVIALSKFLESDVGLKSMRENQWKPLTFGRRNADKAFTTSFTLDVTPKDSLGGQLRNAVLFLVCSLALSVCSAAANDTPKVEIFGGYSLLRADINGAKYSTNGWDAAVTGNLNRYFGVTADFTGQYKTVTDSSLSPKLHTHSFLFGPTVSYRMHKWKPFAHALFGVSHGAFSEAGFSSVDNVFAMEVGGGVDFKLAKHVSVRPVQLDWRRTTFASATQNNLRYAAGVVLNLGGK
jgi:hypothetical protein